MRPRESSGSWGWAYRELPTRSFTTPPSSPPQSFSAGYRSISRNADDIPFHVPHQTGENFGDCTAGNSHVACRVTRESRYPKPTPNPQLHAHRHSASYIKEPRKLQKKKKRALARQPTPLTFLSANPEHCRICARHTSPPLSAFFSTRKRGFPAAFKKYRFILVFHARASYELLGGELVPLRIWLLSRTAVPVHGQKPLCRIRQAP